MVMNKGIKDLVKRLTWSVASRSKSIAKGKQVIPETWTHEKKRLTDGTLRKDKARFCVHGDLQKISNKKMQEAVDSSEVLTEREIKEPLDTHLPVVSWVTVRLMMILGLILSLQFKQIDFSNAFFSRSVREPGLSSHSTGL